MNKENITHTHTHTHTHTPHWNVIQPEQKILTFVTTWMTLEDIMVSEIS